MQAAKEKIESHSSYLNNQRIQLLLAMIDGQALGAGKNLSLSSVRDYFDSVEQLYINIFAVLKDDIVCCIEPIREKFYEAYDMVVSSENFRTVKALNLLLRLCKKYNFLVINGLQDIEYFFRMGHKEIRGLKNIRFFESQSIFKAGGSNDDEKD